MRNASNRVAHLNRMAKNEPRSARGRIFASKNEPFPRQTITKSATTSYSTARGSHPAMCCATPTASKLVTGWVFAG